MTSDEATSISLQPLPLGGKDASSSKRAGFQHRAQSTPAPSKHLSSENIRTRSPSSLTSRHKAFAYHMDRRRRAKLLQSRSRRWQIRRAKSFGEVKLLSKCGCGQKGCEQCEHGLGSVMESDHEGGEVFGHATLDEDPERSSGNSSSKSRSGSIHRSRSESQLVSMQRRESSLDDHWDMGALAARIHTRTSIPSPGSVAKIERASPAAKPGKSLEGSRYRFRSRSRSMELPTANADAGGRAPSDEAAVAEDHSDARARNEYPDGAGGPGQDPAGGYAGHPRASKGRYSAADSGSQPQPDPIPRPCPRDTLSLSFNEEPMGGCDAPGHGSARDSDPAIARTRSDGLMERKWSNLKYTMRAGARRGEAPGDHDDGTGRNPGKVPLSAARAAGYPEGPEAPGRARPVIPSKGAKRLKYYEYGVQARGQGPGRAPSGDSNSGQQGLDSTFDMQPKQQQEHRQQGLPPSSDRSSSHSRRSMVAYQSSGGFGSRSSRYSIDRTFSTGEVSMTG